MPHYSTLPRWITCWFAPSSQPAVAATAATAATAAVVPLVRPSLGQLAHLPETALPLFVRNCPVAMKHLHLLGDLDWEHFPERPGGRAWPGRRPIPRAPFAAAYLVKVEEGLRHLGQLRRYLVEHPALVWVLGFPLQPSHDFPWGFDADTSLPTRKHFGRVLRELPHASLQWLFASSVSLVCAALPAEERPGDTIALDTKHVLAWVKENNPKAYVKDRFDKHCQPKGDRDCKLGCKRRENHAPHTTDGAADGAAASANGGPVAAPTPTCEGQPASQTLAPIGKGEFYWGYASGVVATKVDGICEFAVAELTQTFDNSDPSYFLPLMAQTEHNLGRTPRFGALDKAYDAFYVYDYFDRAGGFAAVPWADSLAHRKQFSPAGLPLCAAGQPMPLKATFFQQSFCLVPHQVGRYACPLLFPKPTGAPCPISDPHFAAGGCVTTLPICAGVRVRHQLDRASEAFHAVYRQRTAVERINSQALALGIERPHLRHGAAIANLNTLIYIVINLHALQRMRQRQAESKTMINN